MTTTETLALSERDTMGLLLQSMKWLYVDYRRELRGTSTDQKELEKHLVAISRICALDIQGIRTQANRLDRAGIAQNAALMIPFFDAVEFHQECIKTAMWLSKQANPQQGTSGVASMLEIFRRIRSGEVTLEAKEETDSE